MKKCKKHIIIFFSLSEFSLIFCIKLLFIPKVGILLNNIKLSNENSYPLRKLETQTDSNIDTLSDSSQISDNFSSIINNSSETIDIYSDLIDTSSGKIESYVITDDISSEIMDNSSIINSNFSESISVISSDSLSQLINISSDFLDMSSDLSDSISDKVDTSWITEDSITELKDITTISTTYFTDSLTDQLITDLITDDNVKNNSVNTKDKIPLKSSGLSTGEILIIVIPCILFLIVMSIIIAVCGCTAKPPQEKIVTSVKVENFESSTNILKNEKVQPEIVPPKQIIYYQINNQIPPIPKINKVFEPMIPSTKIVTIKKTFQPVIIKKIVKVVKPIQQQPKISEIKNPVTKPEVIISSSKILPESHTSEVRDSKILPIKYLPKIKGETQILPLKILPPIDLGHKTVFENENGSISKVNKDDIITIENSPNYSKISGNLLDNSIENISHFTEVPQNLTDNNVEGLQKSLKVSDDLIYNANENTSQISKVTEEIEENNKKDIFINIPKIDNNKMTESIEDLHHIIQNSDNIPINFSNQMTNIDK